MYIKNLFHCSVFGCFGSHLSKLYSVNYLKNIEITDDVTQPIKWTKLRYSSVGAIF